MGIGDFLRGINQGGGMVLSYIERRQIEQVVKAMPPIRTPPLPTTAFVNGPGFRFAVPRGFTEMSYESLHRAIHQGHIRKSVVCAASRQRTWDRRSWVDTIAVSSEPQDVSLPVLRQFRDPYLTMDLRLLLTALEPKRVEQFAKEQAEAGRGRIIQGPELVNLGGRGAVRWKSDTVTSVVDFNLEANYNRHTWRMLLRAPADLAAEYKPILMTAVHSWRWFS